MPRDYEIAPRVEKLVEELIGRVADKWTMLVLEVLADKETFRFTQLARLIPDISQKMLTQTVRQMERDGLLTRKIHAVVPPKVEYKITDLGLTLSAAFCGVWVWAAENLQKVEARGGSSPRRRRKMPPHPSAANAKNKRTPFGVRSLFHDGTVL